MLESLEGEAFEVVALEQIGRGVDSTGQVSWVDADEGIRFAGVSSYADDVGVFGG